MWAPAMVLMCALADTGEIRCMDEDTLSPPGPDAISAPSQVLCEQRLLAFAVQVAAQVGAPAVSFQARCEPTGEPA